MTQTQVANPGHLLANAPCHATISCTDIGRAATFYEQTLGLSILERSEEQGIMFSAGDTRLYVYPRRDAPKAENTVASFTVKDVPTAVAALRANGVQFEEYDLPGLRTKNGIADLGGVRGAWFRDPDGNILAISEM